MYFEDLFEDVRGENYMEESELVVDNNENMDYFICKQNFITEIMDKSSNNMKLINVL